MRSEWDCRSPSAVIASVSEAIQRRDLAGEGARLDRFGFASR